MSKPIVNLSETDGNVFMIIGVCSKALKKAKLSDKANEFKHKAQGAKSYDEVIQLAMEYCEVE